MAVPAGPAPDDPGASAPNTERTGAPPAGDTGIPEVSEAAADQGLPTPDALVDAVRSIEANEALDAPAATLEAIATTVAPEGPVHDALLGTWMGHALHPVLTDLPIGMWTSAAVLDLVGGRRSRPAAKRLVGAGILTALPTAATGLAEWLHVDRESRRVGVVHAGSNSVGLVFYVLSYLARRKGHHLRGAALGLLGGLAATAGGYLGGHLAIARKEGTRDDRFAEPAG